MCAYVLDPAETDAVIAGDEHHRSHLLDRGGLNPMARRAILGLSQRFVALRRDVAPALRGRRFCFQPSSISYRSNLGAPPSAWPDACDGGTERGRQGYTAITYRR